MTRYRYTAAVVAASLLLLASVIHGTADDYLSKAAAYLRDRDYTAAYNAAGKSADGGQRSFIRGIAALRLEKYDEAITSLSDAEHKLPLVADYALFNQIDALYRQKKYPAAAAKAQVFKTNYSSSRLLRRVDKLYADILFDSGDYKAALTAYQNYIEKNPSGSDSLEASFQSARCKENLNDTVAAAAAYKVIWLNSPASPFASKSQERIAKLEHGKAANVLYNAEELLKRSATQYAQNDFSGCLKTVDMIPVSAQPVSILNRVDLRAGMAQYRLRQYKTAEKQFTKAATSNVAGIKSEARFWLAKSLDRQDLKEKALTLYLELAGEGKKQSFADDSLMEAAALKRGLGRYVEAAVLYEQAMKLTTDSKTVARAAWDSAWSRYLAGDYPAAATSFKGLLTDDSQREKVLYWLGRTLDNSADSAAAGYYKMLLSEYPAGFYASWYREQRGIKDTREAFGKRDGAADLPMIPGSDRLRLLVSLGLAEEARSEIAALRKKNGDKKAQFPGYARAYLESGDYGSAIAIFMQNRPIAWEKNTLPLWSAGYPLAYTDLVSHNAAVNGLSEGLVYALIRAESGFSAAIKSPAGAIGLMQMMPATAKMTAREKGDFNPQKLTVPEYNIRLGTKHLADLMKEHNGDVIYMAAAYNAGSAALERWKKSYRSLKKDEFIECIPYQETRDYVKKVYASAATYRQLYNLK